MQKRDIKEETKVRAKTGGGVVIDRNKYELLE
jgi:hypothetical protein